MKTPELLEPNKIYQYTIDLWHTGVYLSKGVRLRVEIASASFPLFSRNLNTGGHNETETNFGAAQQTIYHDLERPSHILLPIIPVTLSQRIFNVLGIVFFVIIRVIRAIRVLLTRTSRTISKRPTL
jgi:X-Pro dipeptidyl-peptidase-like protein